MSYRAEEAENRITNNISKKKKSDSHAYYLNSLLQSFNMMHKIKIQLNAEVVLQSR